MYDEILEIMHDYLISDNTDYALLLNGHWGTGKTYFVRNKFQNYLKIYKKESIYVSLNGLEDALKIINRVFYKKIMNHRFNMERFRTFSEKKRGEQQKGIIASLVDLILEMNVPVLKFFRVSSRHIFSKKVFNFENTIIIFDDLERISPTLSINEVLGQIFDNFIDKGIKTVVIGDVTRLQDQEQFNKIKEKIFRQSITFAPDFDKLFWNFISNRYINLEISNFLKNYYTIIRDFFKNNEDNLRTIAFCIDQFKKIYYMREKFKNVKEYLRDIFFSLSILGLEYKSNRLTDQNIEKIKQLSSENPIAVNKQQKDPYMMVFRQRYLNTDKYKFYYVESLKDFIIKGLFDPKEFSKDLNRIITKADSIKEQLLKEISCFYEFEQKDLKKKVLKLYEYVELGEFTTEKYPYIYTLVKHILDRQYLDSFDSIDEELFLKGMERAITRNSFEKTSAKQNPDEFIQSYDKKFEDRFFHKLREMIISAMETNYRDFVELNIGKIVEKVNESLMDFQIDDEIIPVYENFLALTIKYDQLSALLKLNNRGLYWLELYLEEKFKMIEKDTLYLFREDLKILKGYLKKQLSVRDELLDNMRKTRIKDVIELTERLLEQKENFVVNE